MPNHEEVMRWLAAGLPITLLCDLASPDGPDSTAINTAERPSGDHIWLEAGENDQTRRARRSIAG